MGKKDERIRRNGDAGRCTKQRSKKVYVKKRRNPNKGKKTAKDKILEDRQNLTTNLNFESNVNIEIETVSAPQTASSA